MKEKAQAARKASTGGLYWRMRKFALGFLSHPQELSSIEHSLPTPSVTARSATPQARDQLNPQGE